MKRLLIVLAAFLVLGSERLKAQTEGWGEAADGLQLLVALIPSSPEPLVRITLRSSSEKAILVPLGLQSGGTVFSYRVKLYVGTPSGQATFDINPRSFAIRGAIEPVAVPLTKHASYTIEAPVRKWLAQGQSSEESDDPFKLQPTGTLRQMLRSTGKLWAEWDASSDIMHYIGALAPVEQKCPGMRLTCWSGKLASNTITLPN